MFERFKRLKAYSRPFSLMDRISDSDSEGTGSIPVGATTIRLDSCVTNRGIGIV